MFEQPHTIAIGIRSKAEAEKIKKKAINDGYKGVYLLPFKSIGMKKPYHYDVLAKSIDDPYKKVRKFKDREETSWFRETPKGVKLLSKDVRFY